MNQPTNLPDWPLHLLNERLNSDFHGDFDKWQSALDQLPKTHAEVHIDDIVHLDFASSTDIKPLLMAFHPWRKGPFKFADQLIDTEWRSDWKWQRLCEHVQLDGQRVLDVGSGNGYFGWRMLEAGASEVIGIDPTLVFCMQHQAVQRYAQHPNHFVLPLGIEEVPLAPLFDSVFSMGVIYHRRSAQDHIAELKGMLKPGGQMILESIVVDGAMGFKPEGRYARMRNVWWVPTVTELQDWLQSAGFKDVQCLDVSLTTLDEQRTTPWMTFESLAQSLDDSDLEKTVEGYPAPKRAVMLAHLPG